MVDLPLRKRSDPVKKLATFVLLAVLVLAFSTAPAGAKAKHHPSGTCKAAFTAADSALSTASDVFGRTGRFFTDVSGDATNNPDDAVAFVNALTATLQGYNGDLTPMQTKLVGEAQVYGTLRNACLGGH